MLRLSLLIIFSTLCSVLFSSCASNATVGKVKKERVFPLSPSEKVVLKARSLRKDKHGMPTYEKSSVRTRLVRTTAYSHMENEPGAPGRMNASGGILKYGVVRSAAADWSVYPLGTTFKIKGYPHTYIVDDYGSALVGTNTIDIFKPSLRSMHHWGTRKAEITVIQWGSYERSLRLLKARRGYSYCNRMYVGCKRKIMNSYATRSAKKNSSL